MLSHDCRIGGVVKLLSKISDKKRNGKKDQLFYNIAFGKQISFVDLHDRVLLLTENRGKSFPLPCKRTVYTQKQKKSTVFRDFLPFLLEKIRASWYNTKYENIRFFAEKRRVQNGD